MADIKGVLLNAWIDFLKNRYGDAGVLAAMGKLGDQDRLQLAAPFLAANWYPYDRLNVLRRLTGQLASSKDQNLSLEIGRHMAQFVFTGVYKVFLMKDPLAQANKIGQIRQFFFRDVNQLDTEITGDRSCTVRYRYGEGAAPTRAICESLMGWWSRTLELSGAGTVRATHPMCVVKGADRCEFLLNWGPTTGSLQAPAR